MLSKLREKYDLDTKEILSLRQLERYLVLRGSWSKFLLHRRLANPDRILFRRHCPPHRERERARAVLDVNISFSMQS